MCRRVSLKYSMLTLKQQVETSFSIRNFCKIIDSTMVAKTFQISSNRYFGSPARANTLWIQSLNLSAENTVSYVRMVKNGCLFMSSTINNRRSNNAYALLDNNLYVKINCFIVDKLNKLEYTIVKNLDTTNALSDSCKMLQKVVKVADEFAVLTSSLKTICVFLELNGMSYACALPNLKSY